MSEILDIYDIASRHGWKVAHPWATESIDVFSRDRAVVIACWDRDQVVVSACTFSTDASGPAREFPNDEDANGVAAVRGWLREDRQR